MSAGQLDSDFGVARGLAGDSAILAPAPTGDIVTGAGVSSNALNRFTSNGQLDQNFGVAGALLEPTQTTCAAGLKDGGLILGEDFYDYSVLGRTGPSNRTVKPLGASKSDRLPVRIAAIAVQPDERILGWGDSTTLDHQFDVVRVLPNGKRDKTFGKDGVVGVNFDDLGSGTQIGSVTVLADGDIAVTGTQTDIEEDQERVIVARFLPNGQFDSSFAQGGIDYLPTVPLLFGTVVASVAMQPDGSFVVFYDGKGERDWTYTPPTLERFLSNGAADSTFGDAGVETLTALPYSGGVQVYVRPDGDIELVSSDSSSTYLTLLDGQGNIVTTFGAAGGQQGIGTTAGLPGTLITSVEQPDGKIVVLTKDAVGEALVRFGLDGQIDASYGYYGAMVDPFGMSGPTNAITVQKNKEIVAVGSDVPPASNGPTSATIVRYHANGTLDTSFGDYGHVSFQIGQSGAFGAVAVAPDGDIYAAASGDSGSTASPVYALYCFRPSGSLNRQFATHGRLLFDGPISGLIVLRNGEIVVSSTSTGSTAGVVSRYFANGRIDDRFGVNGSMHFQTANGYASVITGPILQPDGSLLVGTSAGVVKLTANGGIYAGFGVDGFANPFNSTLTGMALAPDGDIITIDSVYVPDIYVPSLEALLPNGQADTAFANGGELVLQNASQTAVLSAQSIAVQPNGRIVLGVVFLPPNTGFGASKVQAGVLAITSAGAFDLAFGGDSPSDGFDSILSGEDEPNVPAIAIQSDGNILVAANEPDSGVDVPSVLVRLLGE